MQAARRIKLMSDPGKYRAAFKDRHRAEWWSIPFARAFVEHVDGEWSSDPRRGLYLARVAHLIVIKAYRSVRRARGRRQEALQTEWRALRVRALGILGSVHRALGRLAAAENAYRVAFEHSKGCPGVVIAELHKRRAHLRMEQKDWDACFSDLDRFEALTDVDPLEGCDSLAIAAFLRGIAYGEMRRFEEAIEATMIAMKGLPVASYTYKAALINMAGYFARGGSTRSAVACLDRARKRFKGIRNLALVRAKLDQVDGLVHLSLGIDAKAATLLEGARGRLIKLGMELDVAAISADLARVAVVSSGDTARSHERMRDRISELMATVLGLDMPPRVAEAARAVRRAVGAPAVDLVDLAKRLEKLRKVSTGPEVIPAFGW